MHEDIHKLWAWSALSPVRYRLDAFSVLIAAQPASGLLTVAWLIGAYAIVIGIMQVAVYFESRSVAARLA